MTRRIDTLIIGGGQAGLATSRCLSERDRDHVVLERGRIGQRWRVDSWDSLRLLTPNWMNSLPGFASAGRLADGFMAAAEFVNHLGAYADSFAAPIEEHAAVRQLRTVREAFEVVTDNDTWRARNVVMATGWCASPAIPTLAAGLAPRIQQIAPAGYRRPDDLPPGGVLVVGASASGIQIADELRAAGREVTLAVGAHTRVPRRYRGMDIFWWLARIGALARTIDEMPDVAMARHEPSVQLVGRPDHRTVDLATLQHAGVRLAGRLTSADGSHVGFADDLAVTVGAADARLARTLRQIDGHIEQCGLAREVLEAAASAAVRTSDAVIELDLRARAIGTIVWATGHRRSYPWLDVPVLDERGEVLQRRGVTPVPGLYVLGQRFQYRRSSNFIGGVGLDAEFVAEHISRTRPTARTAPGRRP